MFNYIVTERYKSTTDIDWEKKRERENLTNGEERDRLKTNNRVE
jgi:hypothetical protein